MSDMNKTEFEARLQTLLNSMSMENESNTPDFILAQYILRCLEAFNAAVTMREKWYGRWDEPPGTKVAQEPRDD